LGLTKKAVFIDLILCYYQLKPLVWELATIAESNLYLGRLDLAETFYKKKAKAAGANVRAKHIQSFLPWIPIFCND
jgi:hypothetical protein